MNILVTGGAGYIGSHACKALSKAGYTPIAYDNLVNGHRSLAKWGPLEIGDIADRRRLDQIISKYRPSAVMHFAAYAYVGESVLNPAKYYRNNVAGTLTLLEAMIENSINKLVFSSTCAVYGLPNQLPISENHAKNPINPYGKSKLMVESILRDFDNAYSLRSISLRYFNAAGADSEGDVGEIHIPETHLIPLLFEVALGQRRCITVFGEDHNTHDGTCIRDFIHVSDLADAHVLALKALESGARTTAYNLSSEKGCTVGEVIGKVSDISNCFISVEYASRREGDPSVLVGNSELIRSELGWNPKYTDLNKIIETAWRWHKSLRL
jgi:UDP-arabinose 4-epimerase